MEMTTLIRELKQCLQDELPDMDAHAMNGLAGMVCAVTIEELENISKTQLTWDEYAVISPAAKEIDTLLLNRALGVYTKNLAKVMYHMGLQHAKQTESSRRSDEEPSQIPDP